MKRLISIVALICFMTALLAVPACAEGTYKLTPSESFSVLVNGKAITGDVSVTSGDNIKLVPQSTETVVVGVNGVYYDVNKTFKTTSDIDFSQADELKLGLSMVEGAQVRCGDVNVVDGKIAQNSDSGLRFIATANYSESVLADSNVEFGIKVTAEGSDVPLYIKAEKFQTEDETVFTAAITNLAVNNYNRRYDACAYVHIPLFDGSVKEVVTGTVSRSIYQVSVGIMKNSAAEAEAGEVYTLDDAVRNVLNAYITQTGVRLTYSSDGTMAARVSGNGGYTGEAFFDVASSLNGNGGTDVVITPLNNDKGFANEVKLESWWSEYIRINNNNSVAKNYISNAKLENNSLSFTFTLPGGLEYTFNQDEGAAIVSEIGKNYIKGFRDGETVEYTIGDNLYLLGLAEEKSDIVPGSVVMIAHEEGVCKAIELLATLGMPINSELFKTNFGVYSPGDGSQGYKNVVTEMFSKSGTKIVCRNLPDTTKTTYNFESSASMCYRVGIAMEGEVPVITVKNLKISTYPTIFEDTSKYHNYLYLRYDTEIDRIKYAVLYCVPKDLDLNGDGEYSDIFSLDDYRVVIE